MTSSYRWLLKASRTAHLYLTLFGLVLILFFAVTGFMLNHEDWFLPAEPRTHTANGKLSASLLGDVDRFEVSEALRREFGAAGTVSSFRTEEDSVEVEFYRPGQRVVAVVQRETGETEVTLETWGVAGLMTDLHKGKYAGRSWSLVIDLTCILLVLIAATGLILWASLRSRGRWGVLTLLLGSGLAIATYYWLVP